jgi:hypothetical protein
VERDGVGVDGSPPEPPEGGRPEREQSVLSIRSSICIQLEAKIVHRLSYSR